VLPSVTVACGTAGCRHNGRERRVHLRTAAPGVLEMPRLVCAGCGFDMPTVAPWPAVNESEDDMPKISVHGGPTYAADIPAEPGPVEEPEGGEDVSAGSNSSTSSEKEMSSPEPSERKSPSRAQTTGSRSKKARTGSPSARSTAGGQAEATSETDSADEAAE
jgi:hypothetical protein